jgi:hypothetical protein
VSAEASDLTGHCRNESHDDCGGVLLSATGYHWWCACPCHPGDMVSEPAANTVNHRAWEVWRAARADLAAPTK